LLDMKDQARKRTGDVAASPVDSERSGGIGSGSEATRCRYHHESVRQPATKPRRAVARKLRKEGDSLLNRLLDGCTPSVQRFANASAPFQIAEHGFSNYANGLRAFGPFQAFLTRRQMLEKVSQPQQIGFSLAHVFAPFSRSHCRERLVLDASGVPSINANPASRPSIAPCKG
jgi:hypothetical protein